MIRVKELCLKTFSQMKLTEKQQRVLTLLAQSPLAKKFYWTGGTLLASYYLYHRKSIDLDFFSEEPFLFEDVNNFVQQISKELGFRKVNSKKIFNRWEFLFENHEPLRIEFVYYNHDKKTLKKRVILHGVFIDSLEDIAANKTLAYFDRNEPKDLFDLFFLMTKKDFIVTRLLNLTHEKFGLTFAESLFWSEAFKHFPLLHTLKPLLENNEENPETLLRTIESYFKKESAEFLKRNLK